MVAIRGSDTVLGIRLNSAIDSALVAGGRNKMLVRNINHSNGGTVLDNNPIGSGLFMEQDSDFGSSKPSVSFEADLKYDNMGIALIAQMLGSENIGPYGAGYSVHSLLFNQTLNTNYATLAFQTDSATIMEYVNAVCRKVTLTATPNQYLKAAFEIIATNRRQTGTMNSAATLVANCNEPPATSLIVVRPVHKIRINAQAGAALADSDLKAITQAVIAIERPQEIVEEIRGVAGSGAPRATGLVTADLTCTFKNNPDNTWFDAYTNGTEYKSDMVMTSGSYQFQVHLARLKVVAEPQYNVSDDGENPITVNFHGLVASSTPPGLVDKYPGFVVVNQGPKYLVGV